MICECGARKGASQAENKYAGKKKPKRRGDGSKIDRGTLRRIRVGIIGSLNITVSNVYLYYIIIYIAVLIMYNDNRMLNDSQSSVGPRAVVVLQEL